MLHIIWYTNGSPFWAAVAVSDKILRIPQYFAPLFGYISERPLGRIKGGRGGDYKIEASIVVTIIDIAWMTFFYIRYLQNTKKQKQ